MKFNTKFCVTKKKLNINTFEFSLISIDNRVIQTVETKFTIIKYIKIIISSNINALL